ncbi:hypothetical protein NRB56_45140 [Nocardia sp. RB56]|uniref:Uncharacterized protein n=2 Tax=Nocardia aurantia TaxID=2585199 RepID=A0A7K0DT26_9NOCA|nr:hypothetical protein [Nocardia aurantia]
MAWAASCLVLVAVSGCVGAVDRADFEQRMRARGGGLVSELPRDAITALRTRLGVNDIDANVLLLTAPDSRQFRLVVNEQPPQVTRFLAGREDLSSREPVLHIRVRDPQRSERLDDYSYALGALSAPQPVRVSVFDDLDSENFPVTEVSGLSRLEAVVDTALTRSGLDDAVVSVILVSRFGQEIRMVANVVSPRSEMIVEFDRTGAFLRVRQA